MSVLILLACLDISQCFLCSPVSCKSSLTPFATNQCMQATSLSADQDLILLAKCTDLYYSYCPPIFANQTCGLPPQSPFVNVAAPGEPCTLDINCIDSLCFNYICKGFGQNTPCLSDSQCDVGYFCNVVCTPLVPIAGTCTRDQMCVNNAGCYSGTCTAYYSLPYNTEISDCVDNENFLCASGSCQEVADSFYCVGSDQSSASLPIACFDDVPCTINKAVGPASNYTTSCTCGYNGVESGICNLAAGDPIYKNYTAAMKLWIGTVNVRSCHTTRRFNLNCIQHYWDYTNFTTLAYFQEYALNYPGLVFNDNCVKAIFQSYFWNLQTQYNNLPNNNNHSISFGFIFGLALGVIYLG